MDTVKVKKNEQTLFHRQFLGGFSCNNQNEIINNVVRFWLPKHLSVQVVVLVNMLKTGIRGWKYCVVTHRHTCIDLVVVPKIECETIKNDMN